jgi:hypothetical protein
VIQLLIPALLLILGWAALTILARRNETKVEADWLYLLNSDKRRLLTDAHTYMLTNATLIGETVGWAAQNREVGDVARAMKLLRHGSKAIKIFTPNLLSMLTEMAKFSRMVSAMIPVTPLIPSDFRLAEIANLAVLNSVLHHLIVSTRQRFRLKIYVIGRSVSIASSCLLERMKSVIKRRSLEEEEWEEIVEIEQDFRMLSRESAESFHGLLQALPDDAARQLAQELGLRSKEKLLPLA